MTFSGAAGQTSFVESHEANEGYPLYDSAEPTQIYNKKLWFADVRVRTGITVD